VILEERKDQKDCKDSKDERWLLVLGALAVL
jgi:hypothetical protein